MGNRFYTSPVGERFWDKVDDSEGLDACWEWMGAVGTHGYGTFWMHDNVFTTAHRWAWEFARDEIPAGYDVDHLCRNRTCVNPDHLEPVTRRTNLLRGKTKTAEFAIRSACNRGHPFDDTNTIWRTDKRGRRYRKCRECAKDQR